MKKIILLFLIISIFLFAGCNISLNQNGGSIITDIPEESNTEDIITDIENSINKDDSALDTKTNYNSNATIIDLNNDNPVITGSGAILENDIIKITEANDYVLSGIFTGQIYVNVDDNVHLFLNGCNITSNNSSAIAIFGKKKKIITLLDNTENYLTDSSNYSLYYNTENDEPNGALFSKKALTINGTGKLIVNGKFNNGISCKDELKIMSGIINVTAKNNGIKGNDSVIIKDGDITINSESNGIKSDNETENFGTIFIEKAKINITSNEDGIEAYSYINIKSGEIKVTTYGGANSTSSSPRPDDWGSSSSSEISRKGIKSDFSILIEGGTLEFNTYDDAIHTNDTIIIENGTLKIQSGDDGIHANELLKINGGDINITKSYEGIEAAKININGGTNIIVSSDDGINSSDGTTNRMGYVNPNCNLIINGGSIYVNASGDGVDSNGTIVINGGNLFISGPTNSGNGALDSEGGILMNGGVLIAVGSLGMVEVPSSNSSQYVVSYTSSSNISANTKINIRDIDNNILAEFTPEKQYRSIIISIPQMEKGNTYSIYTNNTLSTTFTISKIITTIGSNQGGGGRPW